MRGCETGCLGMVVGLGLKVPEQMLGVEQRISNEAKGWKSRWCERIYVVEHRPGAYGEEKCLIFEQKATKVIAPRSSGKENRCKM